ncbi:piggyBac transposable element-derived protein 4 [Trichonephila clavipes]|nr:piggyBac transposable element-derived protein 4 [Trichonephila clavipes]
MRIRKWLHLELIVYTGKGTAFNENYNDYGFSTKSALTLIHELKGKGNCLSTDNFYTSPELAELLIDSETDIWNLTTKPKRFTCFIKKLHSEESGNYSLPKG